MRNKLFIVFLIFICSCKSEKKEKLTSLEESPSPKPNIIFLYADDLGYGDVGCYGATGVKTKHIDALAKGGLQFTDAHCSAATCTPSRYSLLTGNYAFRNNAAILPGDAPLLIDTSIVTLPKMLKSVGYNTAIVGKWHLGLGLGKVNWNKHITPGANEVGFDYSYIIPATGDRVPTVFVENGKVVNLSEEDPLVVSYKEKVGNRPTGIEHPELLKMKADEQHSQTIVNGISRIGYMGGGKSAEWVDEEFPHVLTNKAKQFIQENKNNPFFLYYAFHDIHVPRSPNAMFKGKSDMGPRGDAIYQMDYVVGEITKQLQKLKIADNTLIIFTSDNGPVLDDGYADMAKQLVGSHKPSGPYRGGKYSSYEAGTRVPAIVYWPEKVSKGKSSAMVNQVDLYASIANLVQAEIPNTIIDSKNQLNAWLGKNQKGRKIMLEEGFTLAIREGKWKYIQPLGGKSVPQWMENKTDIESGLMEIPQLFNLNDDPGEKHNLAEQLPDKVMQMQRKIDSIKKLSNHS